MIIKNMGGKFKSFGFKLIVVTFIGSAVAVGWNIKHGTQCYTISRRAHDDLPISLELGFFTISDKERFAFASCTGNVIKSLHSGGEYISVYYTRSGSVPDGQKLFTESFSESAGSMSVTAYEEPSLNSKKISKNVVSNNLSYYYLVPKNRSGDNGRGVPVIYFFPDVESASEMGLLVVEW